MDTPTQNQSLFEVEASELLDELTEAHYQAARNNESISQMVAMASFDGSSNAMASCGAALLTTGKKHGPLDECRDLLLGFRMNPRGVVDMMKHYVNAGEKIPGVGNSFFKDSVDPSFAEVVRRYCELHRSVHGLNSETIMDAYVKAANRCISDAKSEPIKLYPNAALITAAVCDLLNRPRYEQNWYFIAGRTRAWLEIMADMKK